jgi:ribonuclease BN (tRNA processing enzyme)
MQGDLPGTAAAGDGVVLTAVGVGEAFDGAGPNTSLLFESGPVRLLMDCGPLVPPAVWAAVDEKDALAGVWLSHDHADHVFGLPALIGRMWDGGRTHPLAVLGATGVLGRVESIVDLAYPTLREKLRFRLDEVVVEPGAVVAWNGLELRTAETGHRRKNLCLRVTLPGGIAVAYSGDGAPTAASADLCRGAYWVQECYTERAEDPNHAGLDELERLLPELRPARLGLVHLSRHRGEIVRAAAERLAGQGWPVEVLERGTRWVVTPGEAT